MTLLRVLVVATSLVTWSVRAPADELTMKDVERTASKIDKPMGPVLSRFVRVDLAGDATASGYSAAVPVGFLPLRLVEQSQVSNVEQYFSLPPEGFSFQNPRGLFELVADDSGIPAKTHALTISGAALPYLKALLRAANPTVCSKLDIDRRLGIVGVAGWGLTGDDISSALRLPFKTAPAARLNTSFSILFVTPYESPDTGSFNVLHAEATMVGFMNKLGLGEAVFPEYVDEYIADPYKESLSDGDPKYIEAIDKMYDDVLKRDGNPSLVPKLQCGTAPPIEFDLRTKTTSVSDDASRPFRLTYWQRAETSGFQTLSSFSQPQANANKGEVWVFLTPLSIPDVGLVSLALCREMVRALRTHWLFTDDFPDTTLLPAFCRIAFRESLKRATLPLWEYLALTNTLERMKGMDKYTKTPPIAFGPGGRLPTSLHSEVVPMLMNPPAKRTGEVSIDDCHNGSYLFLHDDFVDNLYASVVFRSWRNWKRWQDSAPDSDLSKRTISRSVIDGVIDLVAAGYTRYNGHRPNTVLPCETQALRSVHGYLTTTSTDPYVPREAELELLDHTDLEWLATNIRPPYEGSDAFLTDFQATGLCRMTALVYPLLPLRGTVVGERLVHFVRGRTDGSVVQKGVSAIRGLPWHPKAEEPSVMVVDDASLDRLHSVCNQLASTCRSKLTTAGRDAATTKVTDRSPGTVALNEQRADHCLLTKADFEGFTVDSARWFIVLNFERRLVERWNRLDELRRSGVDLTYLVEGPHPSNKSLKDIRSSSTTPMTTGEAEAGDALQDIVVAAQRCIDGGQFGQDTAVTRNVKLKNELLKDLTDDVVVRPDRLPRRLLRLHLTEPDPAKPAKLKPATIDRLLRGVARTLGRTPIVFVSADGKEITQW